MSNFTFSTQNFWRGHSGLGCFSLSILQGRSLRLWSSLVSSECKVMQSDTSLSLICNLFVVISVWAWEWYKMEAHKIRRDIKLCTVVYNIHTKKKNQQQKTLLIELAKPVINGALPLSSAYGVRSMKKSAVCSGWLPNVTTWPPHIIVHETLAELF